MAEEKRVVSDELRCNLVLGLNIKVVSVINRGILRVIQTGYKMNKTCPVLFLRALDLFRPILRGIIAAPFKFVC